MEQLTILGALAVLVIVVVAHLAPRLGVAAPVLLVVIGILVSYVPGTPHVAVDPHLILAVVLPPILYSAAITVPAADFRRNFRAISALAVVFVLVSAFVTGLLLKLLLPDLGLATCVALGAVISPPDAVAATAVGKRLGLPPRLVTVLEGEGLVNDATALVLLRTAVAAAAGSISAWGVVTDFALAVVAGVGVGALVGWVSVQVRAHLDDPVLTTAVSLVVPFLAFVPAEELHASGVLAVVVAGLVTGHESSRRFSAQDRVSERINWRTLQLLLENGVFLLMGYQMESVVADVAGSGALDVAESVGLGLVLTATLVVLRLALMGPLVAWLRHDHRRAGGAAPPSRRALDRAGRGRRTAPRARESWGWRDGVVLGWSGMRGVVTLAAAQSLPADTPYRSQLILMAFTVAIVTLIGQGTTLPLLIRRLGIRGTDAAAERRDLEALVEEITTVMGDTLDRRDLRRNTGEPFNARAVEQLRRQHSRFVQGLARAESLDRHVVDDHRELRRKMLDAAQSALLDARAANVYSSRSIGRVQMLLDAESIRLEADGAGHH
jgi:Na+/H+ antiporter